MCVWECFLEPVEKSKHAGQDVKGISGIIFGNLWICGSSIRIGGQSVCLADAATSRRHHALLGQKALAGTCAPFGSREKKGRQFSRSMPKEPRKSDSLASEVLLIKHAPISLPVWRSLGNCNFCIYFISSLFYFFMVLFFLLFYFFNLIPTNPIVAYWLLTEASIRNLLDGMFQLWKQSDFRKTGDSWV